VCLLLALVGPGRAGAPEPARRVVSMNPSLTAILVEIGARDALVGIEAQAARPQPGVNGLPVVGGLFNPSLEAVVALAPDLVVYVPGVQQREFGNRLEALGIPVLALGNATWEQVLASIESLGARVGREASAARVVARIRSARTRLRSERAGGPRLRGVLVVQRDPLYLVGRGSFLDDMLDTVGVDNLGAEFAEPYPRTDVEWLVAAAPDVILDADPDPESPEQYWGRWPSLPALSTGRVVRIRAGEVTLPGPDLDRALQRLDAAVHPR
jgi:iron complex transport system substrate-binding protein